METKNNDAVRSLKDLKYQEILIPMKIDALTVISSSIADKLPTLIKELCTKFGVVIPANIKTLQEIEEFSMMSDFKSIVIQKVTQKVLNEVLFLKD